jgi:ketosteroid isomerase-like protein
MSKGNVNIVRGLYDVEDAVATVRDDQLWAAWVGSVGSHFHPDFEGCFVTGVGGAGRGEPFIGLDGFREFCLEWFAPMTAHRGEVQRIMGLGERVLVLLREYVRLPINPAEVHADTAHVITFRDGKIALFEGFFNRSHALEAVGLSEQDARVGS